MIVLLIILSSIFLFAAFLENLSITITNPFVGYIFFQLNFLLENFSFFIIGFLLIFFFFIRQTHHIRHLSHNMIYRSFIQTCALVTTSIFLAFIGLLVIAWIQLNTYAIVVDINPSLLGITTNTTAILKILQKDTSPPLIIPSGQSSQQKASALAMATVGTTNFYGNTILASIPDFLIFPIKKFPSSFIFLDNKLIVTRMNTQDLQIISPILGYLFVQEYFPNRPIKSFPKAYVMSQNQFITYQKKDARNKLSTVSIDIQKMENGISSFSASIKQDNVAITENQTLTAKSMGQRNSQYDTCLSTGNYKTGKFVPEYTKAYCQKILDQWNTTLTTQGNTADKLGVKLQQDQQELKTYQYYDSFFKAQKTLMEISSNNIADELGVFQPPNVIKIVVSNNGTTDMTDYFETLCHEYLHYASYIPGKRFDSTFFEEGFTEYFARQTIKDNMNVDSNFAYPAQVKIIQAITKRIAEPDLADLYFTKDEVNLENELNLAYGDNFYKDNYVFFESLQYTTDPKQIIQLTNTILKNMGEKSLQEKDIFGQ